ncbi:hypothetical protein [Mycobacterium sp. 155]|uniref:hypothetical protein n=1 Tax=Mycobacterium sp. 155 TaxID=1157943 RepID=UPI0003A9E69A|nr:hypothetical protein [Mycobacterium sp. 155]
MLDDMIDVDAFIRDGFVKVEQAVPCEIAEEARDLLWAQIGLAPTEPQSWKQPVVWTADLTGAGPFGELASMLLLTEPHTPPASDT